MNKHFLVAFDGSGHSKAALEYVARLYREADEVEITVATVLPPLPYASAYGASSFSAEKKRLLQMAEVEQARNRQAGQVLEQAERILEGLGFPQERFHTRMLTSSATVAQEIASVARQGLFDAIVLGRRGLGKLVSYFLGSVSGGVLENVKEIPVWIIDSPPENQRFLVAVDACEPCLKVLDHVAFVLAGMPGVFVEVFHVIPRAIPFLSSHHSADLQEMDSLLSKVAEEEVKALLSGCREMFEAEGFGPGQVQVKVQRGGISVAAEIEEEFKRGDFSTLVMGRRGIGGWEALFPGSVSNALLSSIKGKAFFIVT